MTPIKTPLEVVSERLDKADNKFAEAEKIATESSSSAELDALASKLDLHYLPSIQAKIQSRFVELQKDVRTTVNDTTLNNLKSLKLALQSRPGETPTVTPPVQRKDFLTDPVGAVKNWFKGTFQNFTMPTWAMKGYYFLCSNSKFLNLGGLTAFGDMIAEHGKKGMALLEISEAIAMSPYKDKFKFNGVCNENEWELLKKKFTPDPSAINQNPTTARGLTVAYMEMMNKVTPLSGSPISISVTEILKDQKTIEATIASRERDTKAQTVMKDPDWQRLGVKSVEWGNDAVATFNRSTGKVTVNASDIGPDGKPLNNAKILLETAGQIPNAVVLTIGGPKFSLEVQNGQKVASLPANCNASIIPTLNELLRKAPWNEFNEIALDTNQKRSVISLTNVTLRVTPQPRILNALAANIETVMAQAESTEQWSFKDNNLLPVGITPVPVS